MTKTVGRMEWFLNELEAEDWEATEGDVTAVLNGNLSDYCPAFVDTVLELDKEWGED